MASAAQDEAMSMHLVDLLKLSSQHTVVFEGYFDIDAVRSIAAYDQIVFLGATHDVIKQSYFDRQDKDDNV